MREKRADFYQVTLIVLAVVITGLFGIFVYRELFPEYKTYQNRYVELEELRSEETGVPPAPFRGGVKQIVLADPNNGPETIDRCVSCHVAMKLPHFSPTKLSYDVNGNLVVDENGVPVRVPNNEYVWGKIDQRISELLDDEVLAQLEVEGDSKEVRRRKKLAESLEELKKGELHGHEIDMTRVLAMHPLIGRETAPFQYHSMEDFGCTVCHSGNGRGLTTPRAHGPVIDGEYHAASHGPKPKFLEEDPENDPLFARVFNDKPGHDLLFQTTPVLRGALLESRCVQCHQSGKKELQNVVDSVSRVSNRKNKQLIALEESVEQEKETLSSLLALRFALEEKGYKKTIEKIREGLQDLRLSSDEEKRLEGNLSYLHTVVSDRNSAGEAADRRRLEQVVDQIDRDLIAILGSESAAKNLRKVGSWDRELRDEEIQKQLSENSKNGSYHEKIESIAELRSSVQNLDDAAQPVGLLATNDIHGEFDQDLHSYTRGEQLFLSQACYGCHQINGLSRGGVGPELSAIGLQYPWYVKESIVWPQGNLPTSTMPNFKLDHEEVEDIMTFLMAQRGEEKNVSEVDKTLALKSWQEGAPMPWEKPVPASEIEDVDAGKVVFATQGCASCHKLRGYRSHIGFQIERGSPSVEKLHKEREWFKKVFPQYISGSQIVAAIHEHRDELKKRIASHVRPTGELEEINEQIPDGVASYLSNFKYAFRAKNAALAAKAGAAKEPAALAAVEKERKEWQEQVTQIMMVFVQEYGLGRDIGPHLHWSGVYRDEQWLVEHFRKPTMHVAKSVMPALPFDDSKFYQLTNMLQKVAVENRDRDREIVESRGFDPEHSYNQHCASCHGEYLHGNGPIARWIYPIPKNLRNPTFMRNLTRERVVNSIVHGVKGTPMPPWGEDALATEGKGNPVFSESEIEQLVDWLFLALPGGRVIESDDDVQKWRYTPEDFLDELEAQGAREEKDEQTLSSSDRNYLKSVLPSIEGYYAALEPAGYVTEQEKRLSSVFDVKKAGKGSVGPYDYYLKEKFFTEENILAGQELFLNNCSHCHGKEGGGNGDRATIMVDAKPRMLSNLPWIETRDDLRLLRSIKFGVPGTSMTPWGDKTSAWQRLQIVTYIRSLTSNKKETFAVSDAIYNSFEKSRRQVEKAQAAQNKETESVRIAYQLARKSREQTFDLVREGEASPDDASEAYEKELELLTSLQNKEKLEGTLATLTNEIRKEQKVLQDLGRGVIDRHLPSSIQQKYLSLVKTSESRYSLRGNTLEVRESAKADLLQQELTQEIDHFLAAREGELAKKQIKAAGQLPSAERTEAVQQLEVQKSAYRKLRRQLLSSQEQATKSWQKQQALVEQYQRQLKGRDS